MNAQFYVGEMFSIDFAYKIHLLKIESGRIEHIQCQLPSIAPIEAGYQHAVAVIMAMKSYETGQKTIYDAENRKILTS